MKNGPNYLGLLATAKQAARLVAAFRPPPGLGHPGGTAPPEAGGGCLAHRLATGLFMCRPSLEKTRRCESAGLCVHRVSKSGIAAGASHRALQGGHRSDRRCAPTKGRLLSLCPEHSAFPFLLSAEADRPARAKVRPQGKGGQRFLELQNTAFLAPKHCLSLRC